MSLTKIQEFSRKYRVNTHIFNKQVRLIGDNITPGVYPKNVALNIANTLGLDLVEISESSGVSICRVVDFQNFLYKQLQKDQESKKKQSKSLEKEIRFPPYTEESDYSFKLKHVRDFLSKNIKVKVWVLFKGRNIKYLDRGKKILTNLIFETRDLGKPYKDPELEGKKMIVTIIPNKQTNEAK